MALLIGSALCLAGCGSEPDFDEKYASRQEQLLNDAQAIDHELERRMIEKPGLEESEVPPVPAPPGTVTTPPA